MKKHKIFKYEVTHDPIAKVYSAKIPHNSRVLRVAWVDDGFYKGNFLWAIVDLEEKDNVKDFLLHKATNPLSGMTWEEDLLLDWPKILPSYPRIQLAVKEKQTVSIPGTPVRAGEDNGKIFIYYKPLSWNPAEKHFDRDIEHQIAVFKTGQLIDVPIEKLQYLGLNRLWIVQELGLYTFQILP